MRRTVGWLLASLALMATSSCAHHRDAEVVDCRQFMMDPSQYGQQFQGRPGQETEREAAFICRVAVYGHAQVSYARMAEQRSANPAVRDFAAQVLNAQSEMDRRLRQIAVQQEGMNPPRGLDAAQLQQSEQLAQLSGNAFDRAYLQYTVNDGFAAIGVLRREASTAEPIIGRFASNGLPVIQDRVRQAQALLGQAGY